MSYEKDLTVQGSGVQLDKSLNFTVTMKLFFRSTGSYMGCFCTEIVITWGVNIANNLELQKETHHLC